MKKFLYHKDVYIPTHVKVILSKKWEIQLEYSQHSLNAAKSDRFGDITLPPKICSGDGELIELEAEGLDHRLPKNLIKLVYRLSLDDKRDLVIVFLVTGKVKTVWINMKDDEHKTLDKTKYCKEDAPVYSFTGIPK